MLCNVYTQYIPMFEKALLNLQKRQICGLLFILNQFLRFYYRFGILKHFYIKILSREIQTVLINLPIFYKKEVKHTSILFYVMIIVINVLDSVMFFL